MKRLIPVLLLVTAFAQAHHEPLLSAPEVAAWREDIAALTAGIEGVHPNPYWRNGKEAFDAVVSEALAALPAMTRTQAILGLARIANDIDGHSYFAVEQAGADFGMAPLWLYGFDDGLFVVEAKEPYRSAIGQRLVGIGEHGIDEVLGALAPHFVYDNTVSWRISHGVWPLFGDALHAFGFTEDPAHIPFVLEDAGGARTVLAAGLIPADDYAAWTSWFWPGRMPQRMDQLYLQRHLDDAFWLTSLDGGVLYVQYNQTYATAAGGTNLAAFARQVAEALAGQAYDRLILDLRHNGGGNNSTYPPLLAVLRGFARDSQLIVLTSRHTYSAAVNLAIDLERSVPVTFVGEATGGRPNLYSDAVTVRLPNSGLSAQISTRYWQKSEADDPREAVMPDVVVPVLADDWFGGRDAALEAALGL